MNSKLKTFIRRFEEHSQREAIHYGGQTLTYGTLLERVTSAIEFLNENNIQESATVLLNADYTPDTIALLFALYQNNNIIAINTVDNQGEIDEKIEISGASVIINQDLRVTQPDRLPTPSSLVKKLTSTGQAGLILFSSGTTGKPKAMLHNLDMLVESYASRRSKDINILLFLLFDHIGGINTLLNVAAMGATVTIPLERTPDHVCAMIELHKVALLPASPTFLNLILISGAVSRYDLSSLRMITYGTEPMPEGLLLKLRKEFPRTKFLQTFGTSETGIVSTSSKASDSVFMKFDDSAIEYRVVDGELWLRSKRQILGYLNHSMSNFTDDGWFKTGDMVEEQDDGYLRINGRNKEVINVGGQKVLPAEVESVLMKLPFVIDCKAYAHPNALTGHTVAANVVLSGDDASSHKERISQIRQFSKTSMDAYKVPTKINVVHQIEYSPRFKKTIQANLPSKDFTIKEK